MKNTNRGWTCYLKTDSGRQALWFSIVFSTTTLLVAGIALALQGRPGRHIEGSEIKKLEDAEQAPSSDLIDKVTNHFLTYKGPDTAQSACTYYKAIGAIRNQSIQCNRVDPKLMVYDQTFNAKTFGEWKRENGLKPNPGFIDGDDGEVSALYFNAGDLAFARSMHGKTSNGTTAYYVCNYKTLEDAKKDPNNRNALACVAFDHSRDRPFTKFYVFKGENLAPSAALDNEGEKFVPGLCRACHGGIDREGNRSPFPGAKDDAKTGNIGANFLPFDLDNFNYLDDSAFSRRAQEPKFKRLNQMILATDPDCLTNPRGPMCRAPVIKELIEGWYLASRTEQDSQFIPLGWRMGHEQLYKNVVKPFCRTCHVAMSPERNFNRFENLPDDDSSTPADDRVGGFRDNAGLIEALVCNIRQMPNAAVTFDQFWLNRAARAVLARFLRDAGQPSFQCPPPLA